MPEIIAVEIDIFSEGNRDKEINELFFFLFLSHTYFSEEGKPGSLSDSLYLKVDIMRL